MKMRNKNQMKSRDWIYIVLILSSLLVFFYALAGGFNLKSQYKIYENVCHNEVTLNSQLNANNKALLILQKENALITKMIADKFQNKSINSSLFSELVYLETESLKISNTEEVCSQEEVKEIEIKHDCSEIEEELKHLINLKKNPQEKCGEFDLNNKNISACYFRNVLRVMEEEKLQNLVYKKLTDCGVQKQADISISSENLTEEWLNENAKCIDASSPCGGNNCVWKTEKDFKEHCIKWQIENYTVVKS